MSVTRSQLPWADEVTGEGAKALGRSRGLVVQVLHSLSLGILHASWERTTITTGWHEAQRTAEGHSWALSWYLGKEKGDTQALEAAAQPPSHHALPQPRPHQRATSDPHAWMAKSEDLPTGDSTPSSPDSSLSKQSTGHFPVQSLLRGPLVPQPKSSSSAWHSSSPA